MKSPNPGVAACGKLLGGDIPLVRVRSGKPSLAGAYEVTGDQLTNYFVKVLGIDVRSDWWHQPGKLVDLCLYDGDFIAMLPVPTGDTSESRVLIVISDSDAEYWTGTLNAATIPAVDPATISD